MNGRRTRLSFESLEVRLSPTGIVSSPPPAGSFYMATPHGGAVLLPSGAHTPAGAAPLTVAPTLPPILSLAENQAVSDLAAFVARHPSAQMHNIEISRPDGRFISIVTERDGDSYAVFLVNQSPDGSTIVSFGENDLVAGISETLLASQADANTGGMIIDREQGGLFQSLTIVSETGGNTSSFVWSMPQTT
jgi:hypothetical protein